MLTPEQCRAGRALLDWTQEQLAERSGVCRSTIRGFENGHHRLIQANRMLIEATLEAAGVMLILADTHGPGVRLRRPPQS